MNRVSAFFLLVIHLILVKQNDVRSYRGCIAVIWHSSISKDLLTLDISVTSKCKFTQSNHQHDWLWCRELHLYLHNATVGAINHDQHNWH